MSLCHFKPICFVLLLTVATYTKAQIPIDPAPSGFASLKSNIIHGTLSNITYVSKTVGTTRKAKIYLPPNYSPTKKYPVLFLLHGIGGDENEWKYYSNPDYILDNLYAENKIVPMIVVFPNGRAVVDDRVPADLYSAANLNAFANFEFDLINDLLPFINKNYPVLQGAENHALAGYSMGGGQSLNFGLGHLDLFSWIGGFAAAPNVKTASQLLPNATTANQKIKLLYLACGSIDGFLNSNQSIHNDLTNRTINHIWFVPAGGHETKVWQNSLYNFAQLVFKSSTTD